MQVVFLCGGYSSRMFPVKQDKFMLNFINKPLLQYQVELAINAGFRQFVFIGNKSNIENIKSTASQIPSIESKYAIQDEMQGIAGALVSAKDLFEKSVLIVSPNDVLSQDAYKLIAREYENNQCKESFMLGYKVEEYFPGGYLVVDDGSKLKHIVEKPGVGNEPSNMVNILVHFHSDSDKLWEYISSVKTNEDDVYEQALDLMVKRGNIIRVIPYSGYWSPIKYPWHIFNVMENFLINTQSSISPKARISDRALIEGHVIIGDDVRIMENAVIKGPVYIGPGTVVGNNALIRDYCHIGSHSVVGYSTEIKHSYIGNNCWFHSNYIGDSIIGDNCSFGSGAITANFRLDEARIKMNIAGDDIDTGHDKLGAIIGNDCRIGINANIMPGIRIGSSSFIGPQVNLTRDLGEKKWASLLPQYQIFDNYNSATEKRRKELLRKISKE